MYDLNELSKGKMLGRPKETNVSLATFVVLYDLNELSKGKMIWFDR